MRYPRVAGRPYCAAVTDVQPRFLASRSGHEPRNAARSLVLHQSSAGRSCVHLLQAVCQGRLRGRQSPGSNRFLGAGVEPATHGSTVHGSPYPPSPKASARRAELTKMLTLTSVRTHSRNTQRQQGTTTAPRSRSHRRQPCAAGRVTPAPGYNAISVPTCRNI